MTNPPIASQVVASLHAISRTQGGVVRAAALALMILG